MAMKKVGILYHPKVEAAHIRAKALEDFLIASGVSTWITPRATNVDPAWEKKSSFCWTATFVLTVKKARCRWKVQPVTGASSV